MPTLSSPSPLRRFRLALMFLTRLPIRLDSPPEAREIAEAGDMFPLIGALIGAGAGGVFWALAMIGLPLFAAAAATLSVQLMVTGALHEDGLADMADGFGGGFTRDRKLEIMRDSRLGTYGGAALVLSLLARAGLIAALPPESAMAALAVAQGSSRWLLSGLRIGLIPARAADQGGGLTAAVGATDALPISLRAGVPTLLLPLLLLGWSHLLPVLLALVAVWTGVHWLCRKQIQGFTGDTLGASQQLAEILLLTVLVAR